MSKRRVRLDKHGILVRTNGAAYRPFASAEELAQRGYTGWHKTLHAAGDLLPVRHIPGTTMAWVGDDEWAERWGVQQRED